MPHGGSLDAFNQALDGDVALQNQSRIQTCLGAVGNAAGFAIIECAKCVPVAPPMLVVALIGRDEREGRNAAGCQVSEQPLGTVKPHDIFQTVMARFSLLYALEIGE